MIVVVGGIKGGSGKTTIATNLAVIRSASGNKVLLVDADDQKSSSSWSSHREQEDIFTPWITIQLSDLAVRTQVLKMQEDFDDIIIDVGGKNTQSQRAALTICDFYIIPFQPRSLDIWTLGSVKNLINEAYTINSNLKSYALINRGDFIGNDNQDAIEILQECPNLECLPFVIGQRKSFANAASEGLGVVEMKIQDKKAVNEILQLHDFIYERTIKKKSK